jgi:hypothetical protein
MSAVTDESNRQVIPRWRDLMATARHGELGPMQVETPREPDASGLLERVSEFREHRTIAFAADLLSASLVLGPTSETAEAAEMVVANPRSPAMVLDTARWVLERAGDEYSDAAPSLNPHEQTRHDIGLLRRGLRANPRNALRWVELSRHYVNEGHVLKAVPAMRIAVNMAPYDRYILRCAVRLWVHLADPERATKTLAHARALVLRDPWLLASEIAASAGSDRPSRNIKRGKEMIERGTHSEFALSELTSALATIEMQAGASKRARQLFRAALADPNENSVAQIEWASTRIAGLDLGDETVERSAEARARRFADHDDVDATLRASWEWLMDQPFSSAPAIYGSYQASMCGLYEDGIRFARAGLRPNPRSALLLNNLAFSQASAGDLAGARQTLSEVAADNEGDMRPTLTATRGFVEFRSGQPELGQNLYLQAIGLMPKGTNRLRAELMLASERARTGAAGGGELVASILEAIARASDPQVERWARYVVSSERGPHPARKA